MVRVRVESRVGSGWPAQNTGWVTGQPVFASGQKKSDSGRVFFKSGKVGSENSDPFCHVYVQLRNEKRKQWKTKSMKANWRNVI